MLREKGDQNLAKIAPNMVMLWVTTATLFECQNLATSKERFTKNYTIVAKM